MQVVAATRSNVSVPFPVNGENCSAVKTKLSNEQLVAPIKQENVDLANHVSLQIFSSEITKKNKNVIIFLHGGPGIEYNQNFEHVTSWFLKHGYTLVAPEIAGSSRPGLENTSNSYTQPPNYVRDLKSVIQCLRERSDFQGKEFCAVAHSWGGFQLASLLTDPNSSLEDRNFFRQVVFVSSNLDSAQTRFFTAPFRNPPYVTDMDQVLSDFKERHAGSASEGRDQITVVNNPVINQALNEKFSPYYRLEKMPLDVPYLFFHAMDDTQVPASQSIDSFEKVNSAGGNAKIVICTNGKHGFFKTEAHHHADVMTACFDAIDNLIKQPDLLPKATINSQCFDDLDSEKLESKILETDKTYKNYKKLLESFHKEDEVGGEEKRENEIPRKRAVLTQIKKDSEELLELFISENMPKTDSDFQRVEQTISLINKELELYKM